MEDRHRTSVHVEGLLIESILTGAHPPGTQLPPERELSARLGVARPTVREALQRLARDGWVTIRHGQPATVNDFWRDGSLNVLPALLAHAEHLTPEFVMWLLDLRVAILPAFAMRAVERHPAKVVATLAASEDLDEAPAAYVSFDWELQRTLALLSDNPLYVLLLNGCRDLYRRAATSYFARPENRAASRRFYERLLRAAMAGDAGAAAAVARDAMVESIELWRATGKGGGSP